MTVIFPRDKINPLFTIPLSATDGIVEHHMEQRAKFADRLGAFWLVLAKCALFTCVSGG